MVFHPWMGVPYCRATQVHFVPHTCGAGQTPNYQAHACILAVDVYRSHSIPVILKTTTFAFISPVLWFVLTAAYRANLRCHVLLYVYNFYTCKSCFLFYHTAYLPEQPLMYLLICHFPMSFATSYPFYIAKYYRPYVILHTVPYQMRCVFSQHISYLVSELH